MSDPLRSAQRESPRWRRSLRPIARLARRLFHTRQHVLLAYDLSRPSPRREARVPIVFRAAEPHEVEALALDPEHEISGEGRRVNARLMAEGSRCTIGLVDGKAVYHGWCSQERWRVAGETVIPLRPGTALISRCLTTRAMRGRGIYGAALAHELGRLAREGARLALINVETGNVISRRVIESVGFVPLGIYRVTCVAGRVRVSLPESLRERMAARP